MTLTPDRPAVPPALVSAARLRHEGRLEEATAIVDAAIDAARAAPLDVPLRDRILLALALVDLYLSTDQRGQARELLAFEVAFVDDLLASSQKAGSPERVRAATIGRLQLHDRATQVELLGQAAPEVEIADWVLGQPTTLAEQRGRVVLLEFWARSCRSCVSMFAALRDLDRRYREDGLTILALTRYGTGRDPVHDQAEERPLIRQAAANHGADFGIGVAPDGRLQERYGATGIPTFAIIDRLGVVRLASSKPDRVKMNDVIADLLQGPDQCAMTPR